jgi:hypothetical protein
VPMGSAVGLLHAADAKSVTLLLDGKHAQTFALSTIKTAHLHPSAAELEAFVKSAGKLTAPAEV